MKRLTIILISIVFLVLPLSACKKKSEAPKDSARIGMAEHVRVGVILPLTGRHARFGEIEKLSFEMAADEINAAGGAGGRRILLVFKDTQGDPELGRAAMQELITVDKVAVVAGGYASNVTYAAAEVAIAMGFPLLVTTGAADNITEPSAYTASGKKAENLLRELKNIKDQAQLADLRKKIAELEDKAGREAKPIAADFPVFRLNPPVSEYASGLENFLSSVVRPKTAVMLFENSDYGRQGAKAFMESCGRLGIKMLMAESYDAGAVDFKPLLAKARQSKPDVFYMVSYLADAVTIMKQSGELKLNPRVFVGAPESVTLLEFRMYAGSAAEKVIASTLWHESLSVPGARQYFDSFVRKYDRPTEYHGAQAYAAAHVIADALGRAKGLGPSDVMEALGQTDMMTAFGPVKFTSYGAKVNQNRIETYVVQWMDGRLAMVWPEALSETKYVYPVNWIEQRKPPAQ